MTRPLSELGAIPLSDGQTRFSVWAPKKRQISVVIDGRETTLEKGEGGYFTGTLKAPAGTRYRFKVDGGDAFPDPCSRSQPEGPHQPSEVVDPAAYAWGDAGWKGVAEDGHVIYELHVGTFTKEGTFGALAERLPYLKDLGVTLIELMPLHEFPGAFNWGYDGVNLFAPAHVYGKPDDLRRLVDRAHALGIGIIVDVVYNHLGPDGNYLPQFAEYFTSRYPDEWGKPLDFDGPEAEPVRDFVTANAAMWISEFHCDGLRLDATQNLFDESPRHIVADLVGAARAAAGGRGLFIVAESESQDEKLLRDGVDAIWVDDYHHVNRVAATGASEAYMQDYEGSARELVACIARNSIYQGQLYPWQKHGRGTVLRGVDPHRIVFALQNHDQVANSLEGQRLHQLSSQRTARTLTTLFLLAPQTPMLFQGQEHFAKNPFLYFTDHGPELAKAIDAGRRVFLSQFPSAKAALSDPALKLSAGKEAFEASKLAERPDDPKAFALHKELLALRKVLTDRPEAAVLSQTALCLRWPNHLLLVELGNGKVMTKPSEPLLAPVPGKQWRLRFSSELTKFGGLGAVGPEEGGRIVLQGNSATLWETQ